MNSPKSVIRNIFINGIIFSIAIVFSLFICDWLLGFFNFPSELPGRVSHPKNFKEVRRNIEFEYVFETNDQGLRYRNIPLEKSGAGYRIFVSGDSFTEGFGIEEGRRFTDLLEAEFSSAPEKVLFINGGLGGTGPLEYGRLFLHVGLKYHPDALLICLYPNDLADTPEKLAQNPFIAPREIRSGIKKAAHLFWPHLYTVLKRFHIQRQYLRKTRTSDFISAVSRRARRRNIPQARIDAWKSSLPQELVEAVNQGRYMGSYISSSLLYPGYWPDSIDISSDRAKQKWQNMTLILAEILERAKQSGVQTGIVLIPSSLMYDPRHHSQKAPWVITGSEIHAKWLSEDTQIQKKLRRWTNQKDIPFLDLTPVFRKAIQSNENLNFKLDYHWNNLGHQVAADAIAAWLTEQQVFSFFKTKSLTRR